MSPLARLRRWWRERRRRNAATQTAGAELREFVYLDDVSVYSLMASRLGAIATEFTDTEARTLANEVESSVEGSAWFAKGSVHGRTASSREQSSQVLRKSIVQTAFKDLYGLESGRLVLRASSGSPPGADAHELADLSVDGEWVVDPKTLVRGSLVEVEVELEAEAVFRVNAVVSAFLEIVQEDLEIFGVSAPQGIAEARAINRVLDRLLTGLVPIRGRAVNFAIVHAGGREVIVHRDLIDRLSDAERATAQPLFVVGVAEQRLFWKDIRRVLFSNARYRLFCRVSQTGLRDRWTPVKLTDVIKEIAPGFEGQLLNALGESTLSSMGEAVARSSDERRSSEETLMRAASSFARSIAEHHGRELTLDDSQRLVASAVAAGGSLESTDRRREFFGSLGRLIDNALAVSTPSEVAHDARIAATAAAGLGLGGTLAPSTPLALEPAAGLDRFLDTEVVAIYW